MGTVNKQHRGVAVVSPGLGRIFSVTRRAEGRNDFGRGVWRALVGRHLLGGMQD